MDISSLHNNAFSGQQSVLRDFPDRNRDSGSETDNAFSDNPNQETPFLGYSEMLPSLSHKIALVQSKSALKILYVVYKAFPQSLLTTEIAEQAGIHRATTSVHAKDLVELNLIQQDIQLGTEKKHKPTYLFSVSPDIDKDELFKILSIKIKGNPLIPDINPEELFYSDSTETPDLCVPEQFDNTVSALEPEFTEGNENTVDSSSIEDESFDQQISAIITKMAEEIVSLQNRVTELEQKSTQRVEQRKQLDLSQALKILDSRKTGK